jgi:predicted PurR-regulated permease PerM
LVNFFVKKRVNRLFSIIITLVLTFVVIVSAGGFILSQAMQFAESWPVFIEKIYATINHFIGWISSYFNIEQQFIYEWIAKTKGEITNIGTATIGQLIVSIGNGVVVLLLIPVYVFMILFYESLLLEFVDRLFGKENQVQVREIVTQIKVVVKRYLIGLVIETILVATLNTVGLLALGINYAIFLGIIGALLNLIPYVGGVVGVALPMMVALATKSSAWYAIYVLAIYYFIQLIDNNYFVPKIVASKVKLNALFSVITVIVGNALWGISGMFLSIPLLAIVKLIFDHIESLKPWGFLLGNTMTPKIKIKPILKKRKR